MASLVLDGSSAISWFMPDEQTGASDRLLELVQEYGAVVPTVWHLEVGNTFLVAQRRKRVSKPHCKQALQALSDLPIEVDEETTPRAFGPIFETAAHYGLSLYAAAYLELAQRRHLPLATHDRALAAAAIASGIEVLDK